MPNVITYKGITLFDDPGSPGNPFASVPGLGGRLVEGNFKYLVDSVELTTNKNAPSGYAGLDANGDLVGPVLIYGDTYANLSSVVPLANQPTYATDINSIFIGDGTNTVANLNPINRMVIEWGVSYGSTVTISTMSVVSGNARVLSADRQDYLLIPGTYIVQSEISGTFSANSAGIGLYFSSVANLSAVHTSNDRGIVIKSGSIDVAQAQGPTTTGNIVYTSLGLNGSVSAISGGVSMKNQKWSFTITAPVTVTPIVYTTNTADTVTDMLVIVARIK